MATLPPRLKTCLQLIRLPNQFTVPGDILAGLALAGGLTIQSIQSNNVFGALAIVFCLYNAG
jgi:hypothetical protein